MSYKNLYSLFSNINKYIDTYVIDNCLSSLHTGLAIMEVDIYIYMARDVANWKILTI